MIRNSTSVDINQDPGLRGLSSLAPVSVPGVTPDPTGGPTGGGGVITNETVIVGQGNTVVTNGNTTILINNNNKDTVYVTEITQEYNQQFINNTGLPGNGNPGGNANSIQYNAAGQFGGIKDSFYNSNTGLLSIALLQTSNANLGSSSNVHIFGGENGQFLQTDGNGFLSWANAGGGGGNGSPGGSNSQVQYNNNGAFGGDGGFKYEERSTPTTPDGIVIADFFQGDGSLLTDINGGGPVNVKTLTANGAYSVQPTDQVLVVKSTGALTITLPAVEIGRRITVKEFTDPIPGVKRATNRLITIQSSVAGDTIDLSSNFKIESTLNVVSVVGVSGNQWMVM